MSWLIDAAAPLVADLVAIAAAAIGLQVRRRVRGLRDRLEELEAQPVAPPPRARRRSASNSSASPKTQSPDLRSSDPRPPAGGVPSSELPLT